MNPRSVCCQQEIRNCRQEGKREAPCDGPLYLLSHKAILQILSVCFRVWRGKALQACLHPGLVVGTPPLHCTSSELNSLEAHVYTHTHTHILQYTIAQPSSIFRWVLLQKPTTEQLMKNERFLNIEFQMGCLHQTLPLRDQGTMQKRRWKDC